MQFFSRSRNLFPSLQRNFSRFFASNQEEKEILIENSSPYFTKLIINRPSSLNALTYTMCQTMHEMTEIWNKSSTKVAFFLSLF